MCDIETTKTFFDQGFFKDVISALIGTGSALLIFYLTLRADKKKEKKKNKEDDQNRLRHFSNLIGSSVGHIESVTANLDEMINAYETNQIDFQLLRFSPNKSLIRLEKLIKNENYFLAYANEFGENKIKTFNNISTKVDYFNMQIDQIWEMVKSSQKFDNERKVRFKEQVNELMNLTAWFTKQPNILSPEDIEMLNIFIKEFYDNLTNEADLEYFYKYIRRILEKVLIRYVNNQTVLEILPKFRETSALFKEIQLQNIHHKEDLQQISKALKESLESYKRDTKELRK